MSRYTGANRSRNGLRRLASAAHRSDRDLDTALIALGVLPPLELADIRAWLTMPDVELALASDRDGRRVVTVAIGRRTVACIGHDGRVCAGDQARRLASV